MANNRLGFKCLECGDEKYILKRFVDGYYVQPVFEQDLVAQLNAWFRTHEHVNGEGDHFASVF